MPVVINRSGPGGDKGKPAKASSSKPAAPKPAAAKKGKSARDTGGGLNDRTKVIGLSAIIVVAIVAILFYFTGGFGLMGGSPPAATVSTTDLSNRAAAAGAGTAGTAKPPAPGFAAGTAQPGVTSSIPRGSDARDSQQKRDDNGGEGIP